MIQQVEVIEPTKETKLEQMMHEYGQRILELAFLMTRDPKIAEDLTQEVFLKVYSHLERFRGESHWKTWVYQIALNECRRYNRSRAVRALFFMSQPPEQPSHLKEYHPERNTLDKLSNRELAQHIMKLSFSYRQMIILHYFQDLTIEEIAHVLRLNEGTVRTKLHRARKKLKEILEQEGYVWI